MYPPYIDGVVEGNRERGRKEDWDRGRESEWKIGRERELVQARCRREIGLLGLWFILEALLLLYVTPTLFAPLFFFSLHHILYGRAAVPTSTDFTNHPTWTFRWCWRYLKWNVRYTLNLDGIKLYHIYSVCCEFIIFTFILALNRDNQWYNYRNVWCDIKFIGEYCRKLFLKWWCKVLESRLVLLYHCEIKDTYVR